MGSFTDILKTAVRRLIAMLSGMCDHVSIAGSYWTVTVPSLLGQKFWSMLLETSGVFYYIGDMYNQLST